MVAALYAGGYGMIQIAGLYGFTLFLLVPICLGAISAWLTQPTNSRRAIRTGATGAFLITLTLVILKWEGLICIAMAIPLILPLGAFGGWLMYKSQSLSVSKGPIALLACLPLGTLGFDFTAQPPVYKIQTSIVISASPETVWKYVVAFPQMEEPTQWFFKAGLAYPKKVRIEGHGTDATRYCDFSTGSFVEPIEIWDQPHLLQFAVTESPAPMKELNPFADIEPKHLHGYMVSRRGQFRLTQMPDGGTLLEGTSWYRHGLWPAGYWRLWSDAIGHQIHLRVLRNIKTLSESLQPAVTAEAQRHPSPADPVKLPQYVGPTPAHP